MPLAVQVTIIPSVSGFRSLPVNRSISDASVLISDIKYNIVLRCGGLATCPRRQFINANLRGSGALESWQEALVHSLCPYRQLAAQRRHRCQCQWKSAYFARFSPHSWPAAARFPPAGLILSTSPTARRHPCFRIPALLHLIMCSWISTASFSTRSRISGPALFSELLEKGTVHLP